MKQNRNHKLKNIRNIIPLMLSVFLALQACNVKKYVPEDELLYTGASVEINDPHEVEGLNEVQQEAERVLRPDPNSKILGARLGLLVHYKAQREKPGFINKFLNKRIGEEPVYASDVDPEEVEEIILNRLENRGFFYSQVASGMNRHPEEKESDAIYTIDLAEPYVLEEYVLDADSLGIYEEIQNSFSETLIDPGMRFNLPILKQERDRIGDALLKKGYYNFNPQLLIFEADTNQYESRKFDLFLQLQEGVPKAAVVPYKIQEVLVYPNYTIEGDSTAMDTVRLENKKYIQKDEFFKPERLDPYILVDEGDLFNPDFSRWTSRRLTSIGAYKYVNIQYEEIDSLSTDSTGYLRTSILLSPLNKRSLRAELQAVSKSNDFTGPGLALTYANRNLFNGGEILNLTGEFGYEWQLSSGKDQRSMSSIRLGAEAELIFPRMLFPISVNTDWFRYSIPKTRIGLGVDYVNRTELYRMYSTTASFGYTWRANRFVDHALTPLSINYVSLGKTTPEFEQILEDNPYLQNSFDQQFIAGLLYSFTYNGMIDQTRKHQFFINTNLDLAGNVIDLFTAKTDTEEPKTFLGLEYAQYAKIDADVRYHFKVGSEQTIATRIFAGYGMAYGNSEIMPFAKQYFSGGPYSVRAFNIRSLGPGSYNPEESGDAAFFDQAGNVRLEANVEYRFPIFSMLKGAVFADAGNVWNTGDIEYLPGGKFSSDFMSELGIGIGVGLRVDIQQFVIRFDLAAPVHIPWLPEGERWDPRFDAPVLNFGIGYPF